MDGPRRRFQFLNDTQCTPRAQSRPAIEQLMRLMACDGEASIVPLTWKRRRSDSTKLPTERFRAACKTSKRVDQERRCRIKQPASQFLLRCRQHEKHIALQYRTSSMTPCCSRCGRKCRAVSSARGSWKAGRQDGRNHNMPKQACWPVARLQREPHATNNQSCKSNAAMINKQTSRRVLVDACS